MILMMIMVCGNNGIVRGSGLFFLKLARLVRGSGLFLDAYHKDGKSAFVTDDNDTASVTLIRNVP